MSLICKKKCIYIYIYIYWTCIWGILTRVIHNNYFIDGQPLQVMSEHKDLGIIIDSNLKFHSQTTAVANKANRIFRTY